MRHNQNGRHMRSGGGGRRGGHGGGHHHGGGNNSHNNSHQQGRRLNPRIQTFDSNGPDVRIRGNAVQICEKYQALARDAASAGDRILAESYLQHAEHYQRMLNEASEEQARYNALHGAPQAQPQQGHQNGGHHDQGSSGAGPQPSMEGLNDLDQGFLVAPRVTPSAAPVSSDPAQQPQPVVQTERRPTAARAAAGNRDEA